MIIDKSGKKLNVIHDLTKPSINTKLSLLSNKATEELGWKPQIFIDKGIEKTISWWYNNFNKENQ